jgi:hypothetical protein
LPLVHNDVRVREWRRTLGRNQRNVLNPVKRRRGPVPHAKRPSAIEAQGGPKVADHSFFDAYARDPEK